MKATLPSRLGTLVRIAEAAGEVVMRHYRAGCDARVKPDRSPVTDADEEAERLILAELAKAFPDVPVVAEEETAAGRVSKVGSRFFLVDPVDGTKEFLKRGGEFTVNIGEIVDCRPASGVVLAPAIGRLFVGGAGEGAFELSHGTMRDIACRTPAPDGLVAVSSRSHPDARTDELLKTLPIKGHTNAGSSLKFCLVAAGEADIYPRAGETMEWDTAAGHAVLHAAGGTVTNWDGTPLLYGKPGFRNGPFIARGAYPPT
ncbi:MAG TPA: 3'(2'),5'-bisphosphate nucleotidase CysQ [Rhizomicrobium sp.]|jgi:3'(2'), 5'-bisphosphate nucleotidase|nr:3'(2'),5'-bisphosphate nucleotidase CysQ [Rhizomicrobium sp.]